jgi:hypothetical protein
LQSSIKVWRSARYSRMRITNAMYPHANILKLSAG